MSRGPLKSQPTCVRTQTLVERSIRSIHSRRSRPRTGGPNRYSPFAFSLPSGSVSYLHERAHERELRRDQAKESTAVAESNYLDQERGLVFNLRTAFVQTLRAKAVLQNAREDLEYWDRELDVNRLRFKAGDSLKWIWIALKGGGSSLIGL